MTRGSMVRPKAQGYWFSDLSLKYNLKFTVSSSTIAGETLALYVYSTVCIFGNAQRNISNCHVSFITLPA